MQATQTLAKRQAEKPAQKKEKYAVTYLNHSSVRIDYKGKVIYTDPYEYEYKGDADYILISHPHYDHLNHEKIKQASKKTTTIICGESSSKEMPKEFLVQVLKYGEEKEFEGIKFKAIPQYNIDKFKAPGELYHPKGLVTGFLITLGESKIYFPGDTDLVPEMNAESLGKIDVALLPMSGTYVMTPDEAVAAAMVLRPKVVMPIHSFKESRKNFAKRLEEKGIRAELESYTS